VGANCPACRKDDPGRFTRIHPYDRINDKHRLAHHLADAHAQGDGSQLVVRESVTTLYALHERLHRERPGGYL